MDEMQGAENEGEGSVLAYVTEPEFRKQRSRSPFCNIHQLGYFSEPPANYHQYRHPPLGVPEAQGRLPPSPHVP